VFVQLKFGGEDGHFVCTTKQGQRLVLGVADGVSGSRSDEDPETLVAGGWVAPMTAMTHCQQPTPAPSSLSLPGCYMYAPAAGFMRPAQLRCPAFGTCTP
jgi:hypothetical protein